jgi:hypothetical protein
VFVKEVLSVKEPGIGTDMLAVQYKCLPVRLAVIPSNHVEKSYVGIWIFFRMFLNFVFSRNVNERDVSY